MQSFILAARIQGTQVCRCLDVLHTTCKVQYASQLLWQKLTAGSRLQSQDLGMSRYTSDIYKKKKTSCSSRRLATRPITHQREPKCSAPKRSQVPSTHSSTIEVGGRLRHRFVAVAADLSKAH